MKLLRLLTDDERDEIRLLVGNSYLDLHYRNVHKVFIPVLNALTKELGSEYREVLSVLVYNSASALKRLDKGLYISRYNKFYSKFNKTNPQYKNISWRVVKECLETLENIGYIKNFVGFKDGLDDKLRMSSCILFKDKFINLFPKKHIDLFGKDFSKPHAVVRDSDSGLEIKGVKGIKRKQDEIKELEDWLNTHKFNFIFHEKRVKLQRVFVDELDRSGRIYFGGLQCISSDKRALFKIDDEDVSEYDYISNHLFICAELEGIVLPEDFDPYMIDVSDIIKYPDQKSIRIILKYCMFLLNSGTPEATLKKFWKRNIKVIDEAIERGDYKSAKSNPFFKVSGIKNSKLIIKKLEEHNKYAKDYFRKKGGCWDLLQNLDSEIMVEIMKIMKELNEPLLPYHDSIVVKKSFRQFDEIMKKAWYNVLGSDKNCRIDQKF